MTYIIAQILAALSTLILLTYSVLKVKRGTILVCNTAINLLLAVHYLLLGSTTGAICSALTAAMALVFSLRHDARFSFMASTLVPAAFVLMFMVSGYLTWQSAWSLIPVAGNILLVIALWNDRPDVTKGIFIIVGLLWIVYNIYLKSVANIIGQILAVSSNIIYFYRILSAKKRNGIAE